MVFSAKKFLNSCATDASVGGLPTNAVSLDALDTTSQFSMSTIPVPISHPLTLSPNSWGTAKSGNWATNADWTTGKAPTSSNDATIAVAGKYTVTINSLAVANSLTLNNATATVLDASGGTLSITTTLAVTAGTFSLASGSSVSGGTLSVGSAGVFTATGGTLSGVTYQGVLNLTTANALLYATGGLTIQGVGGSGGGTINDTGSQSALICSGSGTLSNATINLGSANASYVDGDGSGGTLTLGASTKLVQAGANAYLGGYYNATAFINQGTITANYNGGNFYIDGTGSTNSGKIIVSNSDTLNLMSVTTFTNGGTITASGVGTVIDFGGTWSNTGSIAVSSGASLNLGGTFTLATLSNITDTSGAIGITGDLVDTGGILSVGPGSAFGTVSLSGTITGGTVADASGSLLVSSGTLSGVTYQGVLNLTTANALLYATGGLTIQGVGGSGGGTINDTGSQSALICSGSGTLSNATINLGSANASYVDGDGSGGTLTLGASTKLVQAGANAYLGGYYNATAFINQGTITANYNGGNFYIDGTGSTNSGKIIVSNSDTLNLMSVTTFTNGGTITASGVGTVIDFGGTWSNTGSIAVSSGASLNLGGTFTLATLSNITDTSGAIGITGDLVDTGGILSVGPGSAFGTVSLSGTITGGTVADASGSLLVSSGTLSGVTYQGVLNLTTANALLYVTGGLTIQGVGGSGAGTINDTGSQSALICSGSGTLSNATINLGSANASYVDGDGSGGTLTLGASTKLVQAGANAYLGGYYNATAFINQGTITANYNGGNFYIDGTGSTNSGKIIVSNSDTLNLMSVTTFTNGGTITASGVGTVIDFGGTWSNTGSIAVSSGASLNLGGTFTLATLSNITDTSGAIGITGDLVDTGGILSVGPGSAFGTVSLSGTITGGTVADASGSLLVSSGTLSGVTYQGVLNLTTANALLYAKGGLTIQGVGGSGAGTINDTGSQSALIYSGSGTLSNATINLGSASNSFLDGDGSGGTLTLGASTKLVQAGAEANLGGYYNVEAFINKGTITASYSSGNFNIYGTGFTNTGSVVVSNSDTLSVAGTTAFTNLKNSTITGGSYEVDGTSIFQLTNNVSITTDAATIILTGANSVVESLNTTTSKEITLDQRLVTIATTGKLELLSGRNLTTGNAFTDNGLLQLGGTNFTAAGLTIGAGAELLGTGMETGALANNGTVEASTGSLVLASAITGTGALQIDTNATLDLKSSSSASETVTFNGQGAVLKLDNAVGFASAIADFAAGDAINLGTLVATSATFFGTTLSITLSGGATLAETLTAPASSEHIGISADGHTLTAYRFATAAAHTPEPVAFGNHHVGDIVTQTLALSNTASSDGYSENLDATAGATTSGVTDTGSFTGLSAGKSDSTSLAIGLVTTTAGSVTGSAIFNLSTDGAGIDGAPATGIGTQTVGVTGAIYNYAAGQVANNGTLALGNVHVGAPGATKAITLANSAAAGAYSEALDASFAIAPGSANFSAGGSLTGLAAGRQDNTSLTGSFSATQAGAYSTLGTLTSASDGTNIDGLGITSLAPQSIVVTGAAYNYASVGVSLTVNFGIVHSGSTAQQALALTNSAAADGYSEALDASFGVATGAVSGSGHANLVAAGATDTTDLVLGLATSTSGTQSGTLVLNLTSDGTNIDGLGITALNGQTITVTGIVDNYALAAFADVAGPAITGSGTNFAVNLGTVSLGATPLALSLGALNAASGLSDLLGGALSTAGAAGFTNTGFGTFSGLAAGQSEHAQSITLSTGSAGTFTETVVLTSTGSNSSGYSGALPTETLTVTGTVLPGGAVYVLTAGANIVNGANGNDVFQAINGSLNSRDQLTGGVGTNVLQLIGGGNFDIGAPNVFANIPNVTAFEGQAAKASLPSTLQTIYLRDGNNETLTVTAGKAATGNTNPEAVTIYGGTGADTLTLATGHDSVILYTGNDFITLGGAANSVTAGGGIATIMSTASAASAAIIGNTGSSTTLNITTAGGITLNAADTYLTVNLAAVSKLTLGGMGFITANGAAGSDTIVAGAANDTLLGGAKDVLTGFANGNDTFQGNSAALNGDTVGNWTAGDVIDITDMNSGSLKALSFAGGRLGVSDGSQTTSIIVKAVGTGTVTLGNFVVLGADGHGGTLIGWHS